MKAKTISYILSVVEAICVILIISGLIISFHGIAYADYDVCLSRCYLDLPNKDQCIKDEKAFWDTRNTSDNQVKRSCDNLIHDQRINCEIDCMINEIKFLDHSFWFYDTNVKNFPLTNE